MNNALLSSPRRRWWATAGALAAAVAVGGTALGLQDSHAESPAAGAAPQGVPVSVAAVLQKDIALWDEFSGRLEAVQRVEVRPRVAGALQAVHFKEGALVKQGDLLVTVDPAPYAAEVDRAEAQVAAAQARVSYTRSELDRPTRLLQESAIAQCEHDERQNAYREADANLRAAQAALQTARLNLSYTRVCAPVSDTRYRNGLVSQLELLDARRSELRNRRQALQVRTAQYTATVGLIRALGGDWGDAARRVAAAP